MARLSDKWLNEGKENVQLLLKDTIP